MPVRNVTLVLSAMVLSLVCYLKADRNQYAAVIAEAMQKVRLFYLEDVESRQLFEDAMAGMVDNLDQYSAYIGPESFRQMEEDLDQEFGGVGIEIEKKDETTPLVVLSPLVGTPAYRAGLRAGDEILEIDGESTRGMTRKESVALMRGKPGTPVQLRILHAGSEDPFLASIVREVIVVQSVLGDTRREDGSWDYHLASDPQIGYLRITTFGKHTADELQQLLTASENRDFEALLIDLRGNAGGLLSAAVDTCDLFIAKGRIVSTRGRDGVVRNTYDARSKTQVLEEMPIAVLVNKYTASASEIVAACLQDYDRAIVVGERTWGKGTVQNLLELEGGQSALKLTTASYSAPSGKDIHRHEGEEEDGAWGVRPNQEFEIVLSDEETERVLIERRRRDLFEGLERPADTAEQTPADDRQQDGAIKWLKTRLRDIQAKERSA